MTTAVTQLLRAVAFLEWGILCQGKNDIRLSLLQRGEEALAGYCVGVIELRKKVPRFGALGCMPLALESLGSVIPGLTDRVLRGMARYGLIDPSYRPDGYSLYGTDGGLKSR